MLNRALTDHLGWHTREKPGENHCSVCDKDFSSNDLTRHMQLHNGEKPCQCSQCDKAYVKKTNLIIHFRTHTEERPYQCSQCDKTF